MNQNTILYQCSNVGVVCTTRVHVKIQSDGKFEARCGFSLLGLTNMTDEEFETCNYDPFHENFFDNYAFGKGDSEEQARSKLKAELKSIADGLWG
jgi:hypothetical protein